LTPGPPWSLPTGGGRVSPGVQCPHLKALVSISPRGFPNHGGTGRICQKRMGVAAYAMRRGTTPLRGGLNVRFYSLNAFPTGFRRPHCRRRGPRRPRTRPASYPPTPAPPWHPRRRCPPSPVFVTLPVSTSCGGWLRECGRSAVLGGVVGDVVLPAAPDDADPGSREDAHGVWVVFAGCACLVVDVCCPGAFVSAVVGEGGHGLAESFVAGPSEMHRLVFARGFGDRCAAGEGGDRRVRRRPTLEPTDTTPRRHQQPQQAQPQRGYHLPHQAHSTPPTYRHHPTAPVGAAGTRIIRGADMRCTHAQAGSHIGLPVLDLIRPFGCVGRRPPGAVSSSTDSEQRAVFQGAQHGQTSGG
jgi:hypothetical protein